MQVKIGKTIKLLRKKRCITQERLAEHLGVTAQAVSRWESEQCYPDIEMLPGMADFFDVTLDELLAFDQSKKQAKIQQIIKEADTVQRAGQFDKAVGIYRAAICQYPSSHQLQAQLASAIGCVDNGVKVSAESAKEAVALCNRILEECTDTAIRNHALCILCWVYSRHLDDRESALAVTNQLPALWQCKELVKAETIGITCPSAQAKEMLIDTLTLLLLLLNKPNDAYSRNLKEKAIAAASALADITVES